MIIRDITPEETHAFDSVVNHPLQTYEWGKFRAATGVKVIRRGIFEENKLISAFQLTIHKIPKTPYTIGYLPKGEEPTQAIIDELKKIGQQENCLFIQLEPNLVKRVILNNVEKQDMEEVSPNAQENKFKRLQLIPAAHPLFTKFTFVLDLTPTEEELLKNMHQKARYNIRVAQKHDVVVEEDNSLEAFEEYLKLTRETTERQKFYAHTEQYHRTQWETLPHTLDRSRLSSHLFTAKYQGKILTAWIVFVFKDAMYYPYGASSSENREVMSSNLMMWEVIRWGKNHGLKTFDMWGALGENPDTKDAWFGFHNFKEKYGPDHVEFVGSYDLVIKPFLYQGYKVADKLRWALLSLKKK